MLDRSIDQTCVARLVSSSQDQRGVSRGILYHSQWAVLDYSRQWSLSPGAYRRRWLGSSDGDERG